METFTYHCPSCGHELKLNVFSQRLVCESCGKDYNPAILHQENYIATPGEANSSQETIFRNFVEMNLYHCGSCGSEVVTNDVEVSKVCSFCGQSAIVYDRVTQVDKPELIIPFKIGKQEALDTLKDKYKKAKCLPKQFEEINIDSVYAIYIPYYVFKAKYSASGHIHVHKEKSGIVTKNFSGSEDRYVFMDASRKFNDVVSVFLNPFPYDQAVKFEPAYLSGFYADIADVDSDFLNGRVKNYLWDILSESFMVQVPELRNKNQREQMQETYNRLAQMGAYPNLDEPLYEPIMDSQEYEVESTESVLCPIYFVTFKTPDGLANILINGVTGKVVGSIPADEELVKKALVRNCAIFAAILAAVFAFCFVYTPIFWIGGIAIILVLSTMMAGVRMKKQYEKFKHEMNTVSMFNLRRR